MRYLSSTRLRSLALFSLMFALGCGGKVVIDGAPQPDPTDPPPPDLTPPPCGRDPLAAPEPGDAFARLQYGFVAQWRGMATTPGWQPHETYPVEITFDALGRYEAMCLIDDCTAFYYGTPSPVPEQTYGLDGILEDGTGVGKIRISFADTSGAVETGRLSEIRLSEDLGHLAFAFFPSWLDDDIGPVEYDLHCVSE